jgi:glucan phosphoethanolaminetransferase (alkaline phosphatase superfamily)
VGQISLQILATHLDISTSLLPVKGYCPLKSTYVTIPTLHQSTACNNLCIITKLSYFPPTTSIIEKIVVHSLHLVSVLYFLLELSYSPFYDWVQHCHNPTLHFMTVGTALSQSYSTFYDCGYITVTILLYILLLWTQHCHNPTLHFMAVGTALSQTISSVLSFAAVILPPSFPENQKHQVLLIYSFLIVDNLRTAQRIHKFTLLSLPSIS